MTLEPVHATSWRISTSNSGRPTIRTWNAVDEADEADLPEPLEGDKIDLGEIVAQFLSVSIDPYPRAPGATLENAAFGSPIAQENSKSLRALAKLENPASGS